MKLNLGSGERRLDGYINLDAKFGDTLFPLPYPDNSADEIRASHVLEHFSHREVGAIVAHWVRVLKPGGVLKISVPNFEWIAREYLKGKPVNVQGYTMGGQVDADDYHKCLFDEEVLTELLEASGLTQIHHWKDSVDDCSALPVSLNLCGTKPVAQAMKIGAVMSVPRLGFMDNFFCAFNALLPLKIGLRKQSGAFWGQCLTRAMEQCVEEGHTHILTLDYDTIFTREHVETLIRLMQAHPEADAIAPIQASRTKSTPLFTVRGADGRNRGELARDDFAHDLLRAYTAHFGCTLISVAALQRLPRPWFKGEPDADGRWGDKRVDDDVWFWHRWAECGNSLYIANRVAVGHAELMIRWPDGNLEPTYQHPSEFYDQGAPTDVWQ